MPLFMKKRAVTLKLESTYGTDSLPTGGSNAIVLRDATVGVDIEMEDRKLVRPYFGLADQIPIGTEITLDIEVEIAGSGAAGTAPAWGVLEKIVGMAETVNAAVSTVYSPVSTGFGSATAYFYLDGVLCKALGVRGNRSGALKAKSTGVLKYSLKALYGGITDVALPALTLSAWKTPIAVNNTNTGSFALHGFAGILSELSFDQGNAVVHTHLVGAESIDLTDRAVVGDATIQMPLIAAKDFFSIARAGTLGALTLTHGTTAGYKVKFDAPNVQVLTPKISDLNGVAMISMGLRMVPTAAGNDEFTITAL